MGHERTTITAAVPIAIKDRERTAPFPQSELPRAFRGRFFPEATAADWNDWRWQLQQRIRDLNRLSRIFQLSPDERTAVAAGGGWLPVGITPYYASLMS